MSVQPDTAAPTPDSAAPALPVSPALPLLTVTADDFGIGYETSRGIIDAHLAGAVQATSLMTVTGDHAERSIELLQRAPRLRVGLHLTLTSRAGRPLLATPASGFVTRDGHFYGLGALLTRSSLGRVSKSAIRDEIIAQAERFERLMGRKPDHLDGHHHAHQAPCVRDVIEQLLREGVLPRTVRITTEPHGIDSVPGDRARRAVIHLLGIKARPRFLHGGADGRRGFFGVLTAKMLAEPNPWRSYLVALSKLPPEARRTEYEMMVHPGHPDPSLAGRDTYLAPRVTELEALCRLGRLDLAAHP